MASIDHQDDAAAVCALLDDVRDGIFGLRTVVAAMGAAEIAEVAVAYKIIFVFTLAVDAVRRVGKLRLGSGRRSALIDAEEHGAVRKVVCQGRGEGAVGI